VKLVAHRGYLPTVPVLVRVEVRNASGVERDLWNAEAVLTTDNPAVMLSTNRVKLWNGLGSTLVTITGTAEFSLTATVGNISTTRVIQSLLGLPQTSVAGTLPGTSTDWSGIILVTSDVTVPAGHTLTIQPNTLVLINGVASGTAANDIFVSGTINSLGTEEEPVTITCSSATLRWGQIRHNTAQPSVYRYTTISRGGRAAVEGHTLTAPVIRPTDSRIRFENCNLTDYAEQVRGGAGFGTPGKVMQATGSDLIFDSCLLTRARMGPEITGTALLCSNTWFISMRGNDDADGIYVHDQSAGQQVLFIHCVLAGGDDDGIDTLGSFVTVEDCILREWDNRLEDAKGISVFNGATHVRDSLIVNSTVGIAAKWSGGAPTLVTINNCTLTDSLTNLWANLKANAPGPFIDFRVTNCVVWGGDPIQSDFGETNFTIGYCDVSESWAGTANLMLDPMFVNAAAHNYNLQPFSPCIDAGAPFSPLDADGTRADLGWRPFQVPQPTLLSPQSSNDGFTFLLEAYTNRTYQIAASDDTHNWTNIATVFQTNSPSTFTDSATNSSTRIYRARLAPPL
jgi:hypothetical protein